MSQKVLSTGSVCPPLKDGTLRVYSNRFCPFAERVRLVLAHFQIPHDLVNIHLKQKPEWFFTKNPLGLVPVLEHGDKLIYESAICNEYLDEVYGKQALLTTDPYERARQKILTERYSKVTSAFSAVLLKSGDERQQALNNIQAALDVFEGLLTRNFFGGDSVKMVDYNIWPWFERFPALHEGLGVTILPATRFPKLTAWVARMEDLPAVKASSISTDVQVKFLSPYVKGEMPNYDIGLD